MAIKKIIATLKIRPKETIVEIGAGHGEVTLLLAGACMRVGCRVIAVEKDSTLAKNLQRAVAERKLERCAEIVEGDIRRIAPRLPEAFGLQGRRYKLVGNIPYYLTGHLLRFIGELRRKPSSSILMLQKEVAERIVAEPPRMNRLAASIQMWAQPHIIGILSPTDFRPVPRVASAIVLLETRSAFPVTNTQLRNYYRTVRMLFQQPRKTILNNLLRVKAVLRVPRETVVEALKKIGINPSDRPHDLSLDQILKISDIVSVPHYVR